MTELKPKTIEAIQHENDMRESVTNCVALFKVVAGADLTQQMYERMSSMSTFKNVINIIEREAKKADEHPLIMLSSIHECGEEEITPLSWPYVWTLYEEWNCEHPNDDQEWDRIKSIVENTVWMRSIRDRD